MSDSPRSLRYVEPIFLLAEQDAFRFSRVRADRIESARDIVTWRAGLSVAARGHLRNKRSLDDLTYLAEVLTAALRRLEALSKPGDSP